eukprot:scaffold46396_cov75-Phaeocystis_antarctica.AAC.2
MRREAQAAVRAARPVEAQPGVVVGRPYAANLRLLLNDERAVAERGQVASEAEADDAGANDDGICFL